jgi:dimeric dUTPase (all-alpha-NTP-PPase superfamily)
MLRLQNSLNDSTNGKGWERGWTESGKKIDWYRCIYMEVSELIDGYSWKHWKGSGKEVDVDRENIKIECVDIWHFVMSEVIKDARLGGVEIKDLAEEIFHKEYFQDYLNEHRCRGHFENFYDELVIVEKLLKVIFCREGKDALLKNFLKIAEVADLDFNELYTLYVGKNVLNRFRQDNGYKNGTYRKIWNGKEDNEIMQEILQNSPKISPENLYSELKKIY